MTVHGVAIAIPEPWGSQLQRVREELGDPMARAIPPHVTLLPPTEIAPRDLPAFEQHLTSVAVSHPPFVMQLRGTGTFRPVSPVVFVQVSRGIPMCERMQEAVRSGPVERALEFPYHPHVTIAHRLDEPALDAAFDDLAQFETTFEVTEVHLYAHGEDEVWRPQRAFPLQGTSIPGR